MGRHSNGKNNYALSGGAIAATIAAVLLIGGGTWAVMSRDDGDGDGGKKAAGSGEKICVSGGLALPVAGSNEEVTRELIDSYAGTNPVVRDYCIKPEYTDSLQGAAVYVAPNTTITHQRLASAGRTSAVADPEEVYADTVGLAGRSAAGDNVAVSKVRFPTDTPESSAVVASVLAGGDSEAVEALTKQRVGSATDAAPGDGEFVATSQEDAPDGLVFSPLDASVAYAAIPLNSGESIDENQARAGQDFARSSADARDTDTPDQPVLSEVVWAAALPDGATSLSGETPAPTQASDAAVAADGKVTDTLFLLDTSDAMAPYIEAAKAGVSKAAGEVAGQGNQVALWNYSSPLNPGVAQGYRRNVAFTANATEVQDAVQRFLTGGVPQTREAVTAAVGSLPGPGRIVVITTGTADAGDDAVFQEAIRAAGGDISVAVVHVGDGQRDLTLDAVAASRQQADTPQQLEAAIAAASGLKN